MPILFLLLISMAATAQSTKNIMLKRLTPEGMVYFIKPLVYKGETGKVEVDFTFFQPKDSDSLRLTINATVEDKTIKGTPDAFSIQSSATLPSDSLSLLFLERQGNRWQSRVSGIWFSAATLHNLMREHELVMTYPMRTLTLSPRNKARKRLDVALTTIQYELER